MRKLFSLLLAVALLLSFTACGMTNSNSSGSGEDLKDGADNFMEDTKDMADDIIDEGKDMADGITGNQTSPNSDMPEGSVDGTMENTETGNSATGSAAPVQ